MKQRPILIAMDLEGVLTPEVWIAFAEHTGIDELRLTTRDISDYDVLMRHRLDILSANGLKLPDIQAVIAEMDLLPGAKAYMDLVDAKYQSVILSDTYYEFASPFMRKLGWPTLFCNSLDTAEDGTIRDYRLRLPDGKRHAVLSFKNLNFAVIAMGDSYNDTTMLCEADLGILFRPSEKVVAEFPQFPVATDYDTVWNLIEGFAGGA